MTAMSIRTTIKGWKTMSFSAFLVILGVVGTVAMSINSEMLTSILPDKYKPFAPLILSLIGAVVAALRMVTTGPIGEKDTV